ncbi:MAG TPA: PHB depolymerase family esterase [Candidatus Acidoferrales bacterium]|nr:PHB depolymerase family esterase [Candidatus Acidoferrales bacterium]
MKLKFMAWRHASSCLAASLTLLLAAQILRAQETKEKVTVDDVDRTFLLRLPAGYDAQHHYPVVIMLHGMNQDPDDIERLTQFNQLADKDGVIVVYPAALHGRWNIGVRPQEHRSSFGPGPGRRRYGGGGYPGGGGGYPGGGGGGYPGGGGGGYPGGQHPNQQPEEEHHATADDIAFFNQMLDQIATKASVDSSRIYAIGLSDGGFMSMRTGCALSDRIAAVGVVGATMPKTMICVPGRPVPVVMINGTSDPVVPYNGGTEHSLDISVLSAEDSAKAWAKINHCSDKPDRTKMAAHEKGAMETKIDTYNGCQENAQVVLYSIKGAGNTWPGGEQYEAENAVGKTSADLNANETLWSFLVTRKLQSKTASSQ